MSNQLFEKEFKKLNREQKKAVESIYWPIMVVAWPWTGKTQIIWLRTANIILKAWVNPQNILITTFTEAWVIAIRERLLKFLWNEAFKVNVSTIHSLSQDIIKTFPEKFIEYKASITIDEVDALETLKHITDELIKNKEIENLTTDYDKYFYLRDIKSKISTLKQEWISAPKLKSLIKKQEEKYSLDLAEIKPTLKKYQTTKEKQEKHIKKLFELIKFFEKYNQYLREKSLYDFNDMVNFVLEKIKIDDELKQHYAEKFQFIMLDEYQDTNDAQNQIIDGILSISDENPNIMVVWDDDQSIYRFQGANIENMLDFSIKYKKTKFIVLENNYRSNQSILDLSTQLIDNNNERLSKKIESIDKKLTSSGVLKDSDSVPILFKANSDIEEKVYILDKINTLLEKWEKINDIAIIVRNNKEVEDYNALLEQNSIETESKLKTNILNSQYVNLILDYLEIIDNPFCNEEKLINLMRTELVWLNQIDVFRINRALYILNYSKKFKISIFDFLNDENKLEELNLKNKDLIIDFRNKILEFQTEISKSNIIAFFTYFIKETNILDYVKENCDFNEIQDIYTLFNKIKNYIDLDKSFNIKKLIKKIELFKTYNYPITRQIITENKKWVHILTAHSSKWLEYKNVFIPWLYTWNWEGKRMREKLKLPDWVAWKWIQWESFEQIEEDRRLFFVAITRAKENLFLSYPAWKWTKPLLQSVFIEEISWKFKENNNWNLNLNIQQIVENEIKNDLIKYNLSEFNYIQKFLETYKLSASDLNTFLEDPLLFLNKVVFKYPFIDNQFTIFGKVYHKTLELFYLKYKSEEKIPEKSFLTTTFTYLLNKEILLPEEYEKLLKKGIDWLEWYYDLYNYKTNELISLEYSFRRKNIVFDWIPITWTIDKIEKIWTTTKINEKEKWQLAFFKDKVALIDYKTWKEKTIWQIKWLDRYWNKKEWEWKYFRQLLFYKLLCELDIEFSSSFEIWTLALDFVEWKEGKYKYIELDVTTNEYISFKQEIKDAREKIWDINFWKELLNKKID